MLADVRDAAVGTAAAQARGRFLAKNLEELKSAAAADGLFDQKFELTPATVKQWFAQWLPEALAKERTTLTEEVANYLARARVRRSSPRPAPSRRAYQHGREPNLCHGELPRRGHG